MLSHDKIISRVLFGAFHDTPVFTSLTVASFFVFQKTKGCFSGFFFIESLTETELENHRYYQPADVK